MATDPARRGGRRRGRKKSKGGVGREGKMIYKGEKEGGEIYKGEGKWGEEVGDPTSTGCSVRGSSTKI